MKLAVLVCLALLAFAANSLFARLALAEGASDALSFSIVRLVSAAVILCALVILRQGRWQVAKLNLRISLLMSGCLLIYAFGFSLAYVSLDAATGALILFACVISNAACI